MIAALAEDVAPDGDVVVVDRSVDRLEGLRHASKEPDVTYLVGESEVLPLTDESIDFVWSAEAPGAGTASESSESSAPAGRCHSEAQPSRR